MKFSEITGREKLKERLLRSVSQSRVSHAQLFLGPEGSGKLAMALAYAQYINCTSRTPLDSCGTCPSCLKYQKLAHPDLHFVYPVSKTKEVDDKPMSKLFINHWRELVIKSKAVFNINDWYQQIGLENKQGIINTDDCNEIIRTLGYKSYESEYKVMIIWMVEKLFHAAAPRLLKILEEPPEKTLFILIAEHSEQILPTILSRTQMVKFPRLSDEELTAALMVHTSCTAEEAAQVKYVADGNLNLAVKMMETGESDVADFELFRNWMRICYRKDLPGAYQLSIEFNKLGREKQKKFFSYCLKATRYCLLRNFNNNAQIRAEGEELKFVGDFSPFINQANAALLTEAFNKSHYHIERNGSANNIFLDTSIQVMRWLRMK
jgi:DNA polymerase-3 subunit delta'